MPRINLTQSFCKKPTAPLNGKRKVEHCDTQIPGLLLEVRDTSNVGTYYYRYRNSSNKTAYSKLGTALEITLKEARTKAQTLKASIAGGSDPQAEARERKSVPNWDTFFNDSYLPHAQQKKRTWKNDADMHRLQLKDRFGATPINAITQQAVQQFHNQLREGGMAPATADHHLKLLRCALNLAVDWEMLDKNPAAKVKQFNADNQIERYLSEDELRKLLGVLSAHDNRPVCCVILWLLSTGARVSEALSANWSDIDRDRKIWVIHAANSKSKKRRSVALNEAALKVLDELQGLTNYNPEGRLFIGKRGPLGTINKVWDHIREEAQLSNFRLHDLRHSYASMLVNAGHSLYEVQQALGHSDPKVTMRYAHLSKDSLHQAANSASKQIMAAMGT